MSAIAYVTDSKMLELHRLNNHKTMNFWRLSSNISFSDFGKDDLVFFLSKDKEHRKKKEKGIVGFGRVVSISAASIRSMWDRYGIYNGYRSLSEFKEAIYKVSKDKRLPGKISAFYLKDEEVVMKLFDLAKDSNDLWSDLSDNRKAIEREKLLYALFAAHETIGDITDSEKGYRKAKKELKAFMENEDGFEFVRASQNELYRLGRQSVDLVFYHDKNTDERLIIGQAQLYKYYLGKYLGKDAATRFLTQDKDETIEYLMNALL